MRLVNGKRAVYILVTKRANASTLDVVSNVRANLPEMQAVLPDDIRVSFEFDQSPYVTNSMRGVALEGLIAAGLVGLMVLVFLRDWRIGDRGRSEHPARAHCGAGRRSGSPVNPST